MKKKINKAIDYLKPVFVKGVKYISVGLADEAAISDDTGDMESKIRMISAVIGTSREAVEAFSADWINATYLKLFYGLRDDLSTPTVFTYKGKTYGFRDPKKASGKFIQDLEALGDKPKLADLAKMLFGEVTTNNIGGARHRFNHNYQMYLGGAYELTKYYKVKAYDPVDAAGLEEIFKELPAQWVTNAWITFTRELVRSRVGLLISSAGKEKKELLKQAESHLATISGLTSTTPCPRMVHLDPQ